MAYTFWQRMVWFLPVLFVSLYGPFLDASLVFPDEREYVAIAHNLVSSGFFSIDGINPTAYRPPAYPLFLAAIMFVSSSVVWLKCVGLSLWLACGLLINAITEKLYGCVAAAWSSLLFCGYVVGLYTATTLYPQIFVAALLLGSIYLILLLTPERAAIPVILLQGIAIMAVPNFLFTFPLFLIAVMRSKRAILRSIFGLSLLALLVSPWIVRNFDQFGTFIPLSTSGGINLLLGNSENTTSNAGVNVDIVMYTRESGTMNEVDRDRYFAASARDWITSNPMHAASLFLAKLANWFNYENTLATEGVGGRLKSAILAATYYPILLLAIFAIWKAPPASLPRWFFPSLYSVAAVSYAVFFTRIRFRVPFDDVAIILAAGMLAVLLKRIRFKNPT